MNDVAQRLPLVTILEVVQHPPAWRGRCRFLQAPSSAPYWIYVWRKPDTFAEMRIETLDEATGDATFTADDEQVTNLPAGTEYRWLDGYWGERAQLALNPRLSWRRERLPDPGDHEHCAICWETIAESAQPFGQVSQEHDWICELCHATYVVPRCIDFVMVEQVLGQSQANGPDPAE